MSYPRILQKVMMEPWAIMPSMHDTICDILVAHMEGRGAVMEKTAMANFQLPREEIKADSGNPRPGPHGTMKQPGSALYTRGSLAVIPVDGVIGIKLSMMEQLCGGQSIEAVQNMVEAAYNDPNVTKVLFDVSSPGGMTYSIAETAAMIADLSKKKETFSVTEELQGSAAQWLASQTRASYATSASVVGSIGVFTARLDLSKQREQDGENLQIIKAGKYKAMGATGPLTDDERALLQTIVDENYADFTKAVAKGRNKYAGKNVTDETMQGQIFSGKQSVQNGLVDALVPSVLYMVRQLSS